MRSDHGRLVIDHEDLAAAASLSSLGSPVRVAASAVASSGACSGSELPRSAPAKPRAAACRGKARGWCCHPPACLPVRRNVDSSMAWAMAPAVPASEISSSVSPERPIDDRIVGQDAPESLIARQWQARREVLGRRVDMRSFVGDLDEPQFGDVAADGGLGDLDAALGKAARPAHAGCAPGGCRPGPRMRRCRSRLAAPWSLERRLPRAGLAVESSSSGASIGRDYTFGCAALCSFDAQPEATRRSDSA